MLTVDPWHWLTEDGHFLFDKPRMYRQMLRIARFIEYGGELQKNETRETIVERRRRPKGKPCSGLMWVVVRLGVESRLARVATTGSARAVPLNRPGDRLVVP